MSKRNYQSPTEAEIRVLAHRIWEAEGCPEDRQLRHWYRAEAMLKERVSQQAPEPAPKSATEDQ